jgi:hypothetical protein
MSFHCKHACIGRLENQDDLRDRLQQWPIVEMFLDIVFLAIEKERNVTRG